MLSNAHAFIALGLSLSLSALAPAGSVAGYDWTVYRPEYDRGFDDGYAEGYAGGYETGAARGLTQGEQNGDSEGFDDGYEQAYWPAYDEAYHDAFESAEEVAYNAAFEEWSLIGIDWAAGVYEFAIEQARTNSGGGVHGSVTISTGPVYNWNGLILHQADGFHFIVKDDPEPKHIDAAQVYYDLGYSRGLDKGEIIGDAEGFEAYYADAYAAAYDLAFPAGFAEGGLEGQANGAAHGTNDGGEVGYKDGRYYGFYAGVRAVDNYFGNYHAPLSAGRVLPYEPITILRESPPAGYIGSVPEPSSVGLAALALLISPRKRLHC